MAEHVYLRRLCCQQADTTTLVRTDSFSTDENTGD
jgi:hypothetical protein